MGRVTIGKTKVPGIPDENSPSGLRTNKDEVKKAVDKAKEWQKGDNEFRHVITTSNNKEGVTTILREIDAPPGSKG